MKQSLLLKSVLLVCTSLVINCSRDCGPVPAACSDVQPTMELCAANFTRWFYDEASNKCEQITYTGCSQKGFATVQECEACKCR